MVLFLVCLPIIVPLAVIYGLLFGIGWVLNAGWRRS